MIDAYIATPYSHSLEEIRTKRFKEAAWVVSECIKNGLVVFSPIVHSHPVATEFALRTDWPFWHKSDEIFLGCCRELWVIQFDRWETSKGMGVEKLIAEKLKIPIYQIRPEDLGTVIERFNEQYPPSRTLS